MNAISVIDRELRAEARRPANYWLRVLAAGAIIVVFASVMLTAALGPSLGQDLFGALDRTLTLTFWVVVPIMTADCISREKREGTLGLLFLTPLTFFDVILGKGVIHALRGVTLFLAGLPVLVLPFMVGGITGNMVVEALLNQGTALLLGLAAGIYASTRGGSTTQVMAQAVLCALGLALVSSATGAGLLTLVFSLVDAVLQAVLGPPLYWRTSMVQQTQQLVLVGVRGLVCLGLFAWVLNQSLRRLQATWQQEDAAHAQPRWVAFFATSDFWQSVFHWNRARARGRNPISWLQEYSWTARLTKWGWCLAMLVAELVFAGDLLTGRTTGWQPMFTTALALGVAFSAAGSFRRERDAGLLEILLVTPISARQLLLGRLWGIFCHYFPALAVLLVFWIGDVLLASRGFNVATLLWPNPVAFAALMLFGLWLSLGRLNFFLAWLLTWLVVFVLPPFLAALMPTLGFVPWAKLFFVSALLQALLGGLAWLLLQNNLRRRAFAHVAG